MTHAISHRAEEIICLFQPIWQKKKAIINVENRVEKYLKWALRAALFLLLIAPNHKNQSRPVNDGIDFPTPVNQIDKLETQNKYLAINVFG